MPCILLVSALDLGKCRLLKSLGKVIQNVKRCLVKSFIVPKIDLKIFWSPCVVVPCVN